MMVVLFVDVVELLPLLLLLFAVVVMVTCFAVVLAFLPEGLGRDSKIKL